ncbi:bifunctional diaminohydroxyphosphoribosylaminopyrimidine deaminase/5-amino-6-(5-phosphoribosylamino)uracil reductase RibD [Urbifossiella limnaea]|uniref:Riboflavin biosynthesis protein RibD n=1 Tax=Urbifossiella limnaea TaxID=2528023 RepID=A0A517XP37_9BACT|nr:bifunctional diaminohydroxyphosphoribosylaminopyrimidine deaminase/5-amino-6-(5-phosphoribosylamino)uracil reductase RibD [Urbifossiella limnaea]QDU19242.1 Riboflavin biosynthesis protein RibD [Urbifossiella limnaea]
MRHALALAARGRGAVEPNPMVGAVVLDAAGAVVGEGWHQRFGGPHAEVHALAAAGERARGGTLVVTLEPCCHQGKTPPCTDAVLAAGVARVVAAMADPFPRVAGGGLARLRDAGVVVEVGVSEAEARRLNAAYLKLLATGRPWVHLKWAMSLDGKTATRAGDSQWISGPESRQRVHELRGVVDAIVVGRGTVEADDPALTARPPGPRAPTRVVLTAAGRLPDRCRLRDTARAVPVLVFTAAGNEGRIAGWAEEGAEVVALPAGEGGLSVDAVLAELGRRRMTHVLVEGGAAVHGAFLDAGAADELHVFVAPLLIGGAAAPGATGGRGVEKLVAALRLGEMTAAPSGADVYLHATRTAGGVSS